jgi:copper transport protein
VRVSLTPQKRGPNTLRLQVRNLDGQPVETPRPPVVAMWSDDVDLGTLALTETGPGAYRADVLLPSDGLWTVQVSLRVSKFESPFTTAEFHVHASGAR